MTFETKLVVGILAASVFLGAHHAAADGPAVSEPGFYSAGVGVLYHFAAPKSLKRQLREDRL